MRAVRGRVRPSIRAQDARPKTTPWPPLRPAHNRKTNLAPLLTSKRAFSTSCVVPPRRCGFSPTVSPLRSFLHFSPSSSLRGCRRYSGGFHYGGQSGESIFALGTSPAGKSGVAVVRISGERAGAAVRQLTHAQELPQPRVASLRKLYHRDELLDEGLVLWFPGGRRVCRVCCAVCALCESCARS
jgi:hypothetical protein